MVRNPIESLIEELVSMVVLLVGAIIYLYGRVVYGKIHDSATVNQAKMRFHANKAKYPLDSIQIRPRRAVVYHQLISGHRYGWFKEELYHVPLELGFTPMTRKRACRHRGKTLGALLLIHGFAQNRKTWDIEGRSLVNYLAEAGYDVFSLDLRGSRESLRLEAPCPEKIQDYIEIDVLQALKLIKSVSPHKCVYLVGHSMGGIIACASAGRYRDYVGGVIHLAGVYTFHQPKSPLFPPVIAFDNFVQKRFPWFPKNIMLPTREIGLLIRFLKYVFNTPIAFVLPIKIFISGNIETDILSDYLYHTFEPASLGILQGLFNLSRGQPLTDESSRDYLKQFEILQHPLLVVCADEDDLVSVADSLTCFENSESRDKSKLVYEAEESETSAYGHCDIIVGKHAVTHVWEKIRIWLDTRRKLGLERNDPDGEEKTGNQKQGEEVKYNGEDGDSYYIPGILSEDLISTSNSELFLAKYSNNNF